MKKLIIIIAIALLLISNANSEDLKTNLSGVYKLKFFNIQKEKIDTENYNENGITNSIQLNFKAKKDNFRFYAMPYIYYTETESGKPCQNGNFSEPFEKKDFIFRSLFIQYYLSSKTSIGAGLIPMSNGTPNQYNKDYYNDGVGLSILNDIDPLGVFLKHRINAKNRLILTVGTLNTDPIPGGTYVSSEIKDTTCATILHEYKNDKITVSSEIKYTGIKYRQIDYGEVYTGGTGVVYDDSENSGFSIYDSFGVSIFKNTSNNARSVILADYGFTEDDVQANPESFGFESGVYHKGAANLIGIRHDFDLFNKDMFINFEWFHTFGDWVSGNQGAPYTSNCNKMYNIRNNSYFVNYGIRLSKEQMITFSYSYLEFDDLQKIGSIDNVSPDDYIGVKRINASIGKIEYTYKF